ncbi:hypothetical protein OG555_34945 [Kribbella sp. NBC_01484]|uniref:hypothetical protein n=1 Tax=Kribbella sp. NBC_01484 TaxID=2903579 RepID=UPI002E37F7D1|nr:hypothetical protein [Kribbella sp. NBC_01484]
MRVVRSVLGVLLALIGLLVGLAGAAAAFWLIGPDNTLKSGDQHLTSKGLAIASSPELLDRHGPVLHVDAHSTNGKPVFVGVARDFDVASYLKGFAHTSLVQVQYPIALTTQEQKGASGPLAAPDTLDWWVAKANGAGTQSIAWPITDGPYDVVVMTADGRTAPDVQVNLGIEIPHAFLAAIGVLLAGLVLLAAGILLILVRRRRPSAPQQVFTAPGVPAQQRQPAGPMRRVAAVGVVVALVSSCSAIPERDTVASLTRPAIGNETAAAVVKHYNEVNNAANHRRDDKLIATIEGGTVVRESQAGYAISRTLDKAGKDLVKPFTYTKPVVGAPEYGTYPMHFVVSAGISDTKDYRYLGVWERATAGSPWMLTFAAAPPAAAKVPDITGLRTVTNAGAKRLAAAPQAAATALAEYLTAGAKSPRAASFAPNASVTKVLASAADWRSTAAKQPKIYQNVTEDFSIDTPPTAFVTKSGAALVFATVTEDFKLENGAGYSFNWSSGDPLGFSPATVKYQGGLTRTTLHDAVLLVPAKGAGKITVLSFESQLIDAGGY